MYCILVAMDLPKTAEAIIEVGVCQLMMNNLNNALKTFERAMNMNEEIKYIPGMCETRMHLAAVMQRYVLEYPFINHSDCRKLSVFGYKSLPTKCILHL